MDDTTQRAAGGGRHPQRSRCPLPPCKEGGWRHAGGGSHASSTRHRLPIASGHNDYCANKQVSSRRFANNATLAA